MKGLSDNEELALNMLVKSIIELVEKSNRMELIFPRHADLTDKTNDKIDYLKHNIILNMRNTYEVLQGGNDD